MERVFRPFCSAYSSRQPYPTQLPRYTNPVTKGSSMPVITGGCLTSLRRPTLASRIAGSNPKHIAPYMLVPTFFSHVSQGTLRLHLQTQRGSSNPNKVTKSYPSVGPSYSSQPSPNASPSLPSFWPCVRESTIRRAQDKNRQRS